MKMRVVPVEATDEMVRSYNYYPGEEPLFPEEFARANEVLATLLSAAPSEGDDVVREMAEALGHDRWREISALIGNWADGSMSPEAVLESLGGILVAVNASRMSALARYRAVFGEPDHG